jgi:hypothetical protein
VIEFGYIDSSRTESDGFPLLIVVVGNSEVVVVESVVVVAGVVVVGLGTESGSTYRNLFGEPEDNPLITPLVALPTSVLAIIAGVADLFALSNSATAPATCGLAIEVPEITP